MSVRSRIYLAVVLGYVLVLGLMMWHLLRNIDPRYRESAEESLVETSHLMATLIEQQSTSDINVQGLGPLFRALQERPVEAKIFGFEKSRVELRVTVVDQSGRVIFDSMNRFVGADFSQWRDVFLALKGQYGARTTFDFEGQSETAVMYVAAPIRLDGKIVGAVSVGKPTQSFGQFVQAAREKTLLVGLMAGLAVLVLLSIVLVWLVRPWRLAMDYWRFVRAQRSFNVMRLCRRAWGTLRAAITEMRDAIAGRDYVADYVQTLTHEIKSPLSAIRGAAELLQEPMQDADRSRFLGNIARETQRIQELVDRLMELAALESLRRVEQPQRVSMRAVLQDAHAAAFATGAAKRVHVELLEGEDALVLADPFLIRRAVGNLLDNALDFSPAGACVSLALRLRSTTVEIEVADQGPGVPDYAGDKVFEKFYSLARPATQRKSTGLGLPFVKEIAVLHDGKISLQNAPGGGAVATLTLPRLDD